MPSKEKKHEKIDLVKLIDEPAWKTMLVELVKKEKMDVWAIDLVKLSEAYLSRIRSLQSSNLRIPANAILACAILLKLKTYSISLSFLKPEKEPELSPEEIKEMNDMLPELTPITKIRESTVSLDELMHQIEAVIDKTKQRSEKYRKRALGDVEPNFVIPAFDEKDLTEKIEEVYSLIQERADEEGLVMFSQLIDEKNSNNLVETFVPLLFLAHKQRVNLLQESFFDEIFISIPECDAPGVIEVNQTNSPKEVEAVKEAETVIEE